MNLLNTLNKWRFSAFGKIMNSISAPRYMKAYVKHLKRLGVNINGKPNYISSDAYFDSHWYSSITLEKDVVISKEVLLLTHDYSIARGIQAVAGKTWDKSGGTPHFVGKIHIGENTFVGARAILLPNTFIGKNCIVGAGSVVKGKIEDNSIIAGNPAKIIVRTDEWAKKHMELQDYMTSLGDDKA